MVLHVDNRHTPQESPDWQHWKQRYGPEGLNLSRGLHFSDETHALQAAVAGHGAVIASELLVGDLINRGMLVAPYAGSLPGANYYLVALEEMAFRAEVVALREWIQSRVQL
ncbi:LysR substrate-binding domain-containing protein [Mangrovibacter sp. MFB070]|uniref:LysR substrate-binding domain-containing protein n=1 Tax=Mangrovibacter sp. MFB070 TaxID=1224318 RepID=UPI00068C7032|nr:LysR substrate-binding domain-containing protein [Mangrovibacter sp. MFB070]